MNIQTLENGQEISARYRLIVKKVYRVKVFIQIMLLSFSVLLCIPLLLSDADIPLIVVFVNPLLVTLVILFMTSPMLIPQYITEVFDREGKNVSVKRISTLRDYLIKDKISNFLRDRRAYFGGKEPSENEMKEGLNEIRHNLETTKLLVKEYEDGIRKKEDTYKKLKSRLQELRFFYQDTEHYYERTLKIKQDLELLHELMSKVGEYEKAKDMCKFS